MDKLLCVKMYGMAALISFGVWAIMTVFFLQNFCKHMHIL